MSLELNKSKTCFWHRVCPGLYRLGDITVRSIYHYNGPCAGSDMWHVIIDEKTVSKWAYLRDAKKVAIDLDKSANPG